MYPHQRKLKLAPIKLPKHIQEEIEDFQSTGVVMEIVLKEKEKYGEIHEKSIERSIEARKAGNDLYTKKGHDSQIHKNILSLYSKSIAFAPKNSRELLLGYSNRSILLMHLHRSKESLADIDTAIMLAKDDDAFKQKLLTRKEKYLKLIHEESLNESTETLTLCDEKSIENLASKLENFKRSAVLPCASDCVDLAFNDTFGRYLMANRDIKPGEMLIVEEGYVCYPARDQIYVRCSHCLQMAWNGIPCDKCAFVIYCTETCKNKALSEYHDIECPLSKYMDHSASQTEYNILHINTALRLLIKAVKKEGFKNIMTEVLKTENEENLVDALLSDGILQRDKFKSCYSLLSQTKEFEKVEEACRSACSGLLYLLLEYTNFLDYLDGKDSLDNFTMDLSNPKHKDQNTMDPMVLLKLLEVLTKLKYITTSYSYMFEMSTLQCGCNNFDECSMKCSLEKGIIVVPCCSLLNHSCTPNVSHISVPMGKGKIIVYSTCPIQKGEMLCDSYQGISILDGDMKSREIRLKELDFFPCQCKACLNRIDIFVGKHKNINDMLKVNFDFAKIFPKIDFSFFLNPIEKLETSEEIFQYIIAISQLFYKHFDYYNAFLLAIKCKLYIEKMMFTLYKEKNAIRHDCSDFQK